MAFLIELVVVFLLVFLIAAAIFRNRQLAKARRKETLWPVLARPPVSRAEQVLYWRLCKAFPHHVVLTQVAVKQLVQVKNLKDKEKCWATFDKFSRLVADFVVLNKQFDVLIVIELDDASDNDPRRKNADLRKERALMHAGIDFLSIDLRTDDLEMPTVQDLQGWMPQLLTPKPKVAAVAPAACAPKAAAAPQLQTVGQKKAAA